jgi:membrane associated rhomboid family serine protease
LKIAEQMKYQIKNLNLLKKILWADSIVGGGTAVIGLILYGLLADFLGLPANLIIVIAAVTLAYAFLAFRLATQSVPSILPLRILIYANWVWTIISGAFLIIYINNATIFGIIFLILQVAVVGLLAWLEGRQIYQANPSGVQNA